MRVLIVDDSKALRERLAAQLNEIAGVEVVGQAETQAQAIGALRQLKPDAMTLDLRLPDGNGLDVLRLIQRERLPTAVIVLTSYPFGAMRSATPRGTDRGQANRRWAGMPRRGVGHHRAQTGGGGPAGLAFLLIFVLLAAGIGVAGWFYARKSAQHHRAETERQLSAIADLKVGELVQWRKERIADGGVLFQNATLSALVRRVVEKPEDADAQRQLQVWLGKCGAHFRYDEVRLLDTQGVTRLSSPAGLPAMTPEVAEHASKARRSGQVTLQDFYRSTHDQQIRLAILIPILDELDANRPLGVVVLRIDPAKYLYPFIQRWPTPSRTAETLLLRRDGDDVLYLNDLRHRPNAALALRIPLTRTDVPAIKVALGQTGIMSGVDYRGVPVLAVGRAVPDSPWFMIAKIDRAEVNAPLRAQLWLLAAMFTALFIAAGASVGLIWRQNSVRRYREAEAAQRASAAYARSLIEASLDPLVTISAGGKITDVNEVSAQATGVPREKLIGTDFSGYFTEPDKAREGYRRVFSEGFVREYPLAIRHVSGRVTDVLYNASVYRDALGQVAGVFAAARDITERKQAQAELEIRAEQLAKSNEELTRFNRLMAGRELRTIELKQQVNDLAAQLGQSRPYPLAFLDAAAAEVVRTTPKPGEQEAEVGDQKSGVSETQKETQKG